MVAYTLRYPAGIPGTTTRNEHSLVETVSKDPAKPFTTYGVPGKLDAQGRFVPFEAGDTADKLYGFLCRVYPTTGGGTGLVDTFGPGIPDPGGSAGCLRHGFMSVVCNGAGPAVKNAPVYVRVGAAAAGKPIGGLEAAADGANTVLLPRTYYTGPADGSGNTEISFAMSL